MSLGKSAERKDTDTEPAEKNETPTKLCSACGKKSDALKKCTACKCVWYCDKDCQKRHRGEHKTECKLVKKELDKRGGKLDIGTEKDIGPLGKLPPREECPICMRVLPIHSKLHTYFSCCGKTLCGGCSHRHKIKSGEWDESGQTLVQPTCAFCRTALPESEEEILAQLSKRVERKDPEALRFMARQYGDGNLGLPVDQAKCIDLFGESAGLGCSFAQYQLATSHHIGEMGLEQNEEEAYKYYKKAAEGGDLISQHNLGCVEGGNGDHAAAMRHWRLSASGGMRVSMEGLIECFEDGLLHHADLVETLQAFYPARAELWSEDRDQYIAYLKRTGEYEEESDM